MHWHVDCMSIIFVSFECCEWHARSDALTCSLHFYHLSVSNDTNDTTDTTDTTCFEWHDALVSVAECISHRYASCIGMFMYSAVFSFVKTYRVEHMELMFWLAHELCMNRPWFKCETCRIDTLVSVAECIELMSMLIYVGNLAHNTVWCRLKRALYPRHIRSTRRVPWIPPYLGNSAMEKATYLQTRALQKRERPSDACLWRKRPSDAWAAYDACLVFQQVNVPQDTLVAVVACIVFMNSVHTLHAWYSWILCTRVPCVPST